MPLHGNIGNKSFRGQAGGTRVGHNYAFGGGHWSSEAVLPVRAERMIADAPAIGALADHTVVEFSPVDVVAQTELVEAAQQVESQEATA